MIYNKNLLTILNGLHESKNIQDYLMVHYGELDQDIAVSMIHVIERKLNLAKFDRNTITKTKIVCIEIIQNIVKHKKHHDSIFPYFIIGANGMQLTIFAGNVITNDSKEIISRSVNTYQTIEKDKIKKYYMDSLKQSALTSEGNAGMGLMDIVFKSEQQFKYEMKSIADGLYSYDLQVTLNKSEVLV
jgi:Family of unknown function (DUF6272)